MAKLKKCIETNWTLIETISKHRFRNVPVETAKISKKNCENLNSESDKKYENRCDVSVQNWSG